MISYLWSKIFRKIRGKSIRKSFIHKTSKVESGCNISMVNMGKHSFCGYDCEISNCDIGSYVSIANNVIIGGGMHPMNWVGMSPVFYEGRDSVKKKFSKFKRPIPIKVSIGHDVWIGNNVLIKQGVTIGSGSVIGMGSVITKNVEDYSIVAGVPGREIKKRFNSDIIKELTAIKWWDFTDEQMKEYAQFFNSPEVFIKEFLKRKK